MIATSLYTREGAFVTSVLIPNFITRTPEVILWGDRVFVKSSEMGMAGKYCEGMAFIATAVVDDVAQDL